MQRGRRTKYIHFTALPPLLFDLERDPYETENRADDPDYREVVLDCAQRMLSWRMTHEDRVLANARVIVLISSSRLPHASRETRGD